MKPILIIDDDFDNCEAMVQLLKIWGYEAAAASTASEGLSTVQSDEVSLLLLDEHLPDGTGLELCRQIRQVNKEVPIIFYCGEDREGFSEKALKAGAQACLEKPQGIYELKGIIARLIEREPRKAGA